MNRGDVVMLLWDANNPEREPPIHVGWHGRTAIVLGPSERDDNCLDGAGNPIGPLDNHLCVLVGTQIFKNTSKYILVKI